MHRCWSQCEHFSHLSVELTENGRREREIEWKHCTWVLDMNRGLKFKMCVCAREQCGQVYSRWLLLISLLLASRNNRRFCCSHHHASIWHPMCVCMRPFSFVSWLLYFSYSINRSCTTSFCVHFDSPLDFRFAINVSILFSFQCFFRQLYICFFCIHRDRQSAFRENSKNMIHDLLLAQLPAIYAIVWVVRCVCVFFSQCFRVVLWAIAVNLSLFFSGSR